VRVNSSSRTSVSTIVPLRWLRAPMTLPEGEIGMWVQ
jgi:hypothetical protein